MVRSSSTATATVSTASAETKPLWQQKGSRRVGRSLLIFIQLCPGQGSQLFTRLDHLCLQAVGQIIKGPGHVAQFILLGQVEAGLQVSLADLVQNCLDPAYRGNDQLGNMKKSATPVISRLANAIVRLLDVAAARVSSWRAFSACRVARL